MVFDSVKIVGFGSDEPYQNPTFSLLKAYSGE